MADWKIDQAHSNIGFEVRHMMVSKVKGSFDSFTSKVKADELTDLTGADIAIEIDVNSINTGNKGRDDHLRSGDFFDVEGFPTISFQSTKITSDGDDFKMTGDLTVRDVTKPVTFDVEFGGKAPMPDGNDVYGFEAETKINREEFGLTWNAVLESGGVAVSKDVKIKVEIEVNPA